MAVLSLYRGDDHAYVLTFTNGSSVAIDITGYTVFFTVKTNKSDTDANAIISKTVTTHTTPTSGITTISLDNSDTDITVGDYYYDIQLKDTSSKITTVMSDKFIVLQDITLRES